LEKCINVYIWCAIGALAGWLSSRMVLQASRSTLVENLLVGMFGAFIGGDFLAQQISGPAVAQGFHISSLLLAVGTAVFALLALHGMRKLVGPMKKSKSSQRKRDY
jgi:uncharacterized membrane protein YeaQ/YmgE (transglycosylase-associated protein family)